MMLRSVLCLLIIFSSGNVVGECVGRFVNPITDICWSCLFPMTIAGVPVAGGGTLDTPNQRSPVCYCQDPPRVGIPISFWEPVRLVDVTRTPYCMVSLGGIKMGPDTGVKGHGSVGKSEGAMKKSFYQLHWYVYPVIHWLELLLDFVCLEKSTFDVAYLTELDPLWNNDEVSFILNPEAALFGNPIAQGACMVDCTAASMGFSFDHLFWCDGCQGSLYPYTGSIPAHSNGVQASLLITGRFMAKMHRQLLLWGYMGPRGLCDKYPMPLIRKSQYKTQMLYPVADTHKGCHPLGRSDVLWASGRHVPYKGEDFAYLIWRKRSCCLL